MRADSDIVPLDKRTPGVAVIEPLIFPDLERLYARRAAKLRALTNEDQEDYILLNKEYFLFLSHLVDGQKEIVLQSLLSAADVATIRALAADHYRDEQLAERLEALTVWQTAYAQLVEYLTPHLKPSIASDLAADLEKRDVLSGQAALLLRGEYDQVDPGQAVLLWAALSVCWAQAMHQHKVVDGIGRATHCPCCGALPVASLVLGGDREGLRYLQCSLCETRWHRVRGVCVNCHSSADIQYYMLYEKSPVQAEACGTCNTFIKMFRLDYDPELEAVSQNLIDQFLDGLVEQEGFVRLGFSPFSFRE
ncbi:MAG: formate dehydrogenase accessory protein FdhE [Acetobacter peroxydans]|jgi:FdhE protein|nr:formate dehydrogenase accessory protein FdhE [Acetobacter peroxydans]MCI2079109.1 formate dehydrogenase accessory protein FdhE [Acetobacter peroxydans]